MFGIFVLLKLILARGLQVNLPLKDSIDVLNIISETACTMYHVPSQPLRYIISLTVSQPASVWIHSYKLQNFQSIHPAFQVSIQPFIEVICLLTLKQLLETVETPKSEEPDDDDEVTIMYYGDKCDCSKMAKCKSSKCICFIRGVKCGQDCQISPINKLYIWVPL